MRLYCAYCHRPIEYRLTDHIRMRHPELARRWLGEVRDG